jgi:PIF1-like helicase/Helitron helicase-like domain at N-terminus
MGPKKRPRVGRSSSSQAARKRETSEERAQQLEAERQRVSTSRAVETQVARQTRLAADQARQAQARSEETPQARQTRQMTDQARTAQARFEETPQARQTRLAADQARHTIYRSKPWKILSKAAFTYDIKLNYEHNTNLTIGGMSFTCTHCGARKWQKETPGMCCSGGKVKLPPFASPPEPLKSLLDGTNPLSAHFLNNIRSYNNCFQMTSFGANEVREGNFMPTFKVHGQVYHRVGSLLPVQDQQGNQAPSKILQIYFMGDTNREKDVRKSFNPKATRDEIILGLQEMLHSHNHYIKGFKVAIEKMTTSESRVVIRADKKPDGAHPRLFNAPIEEEIAVLMIGDPSISRRDIVLQKRDNSLMYVADTHRAYDALQYPLIFWQGQDGYHFENRQVDPRTGQLNASKKISSNDFYAYRIMVRPTGSNHLLQYKQLLNQFLVDMFVKVESERLRYLRNNQSQLRAENYGMLRDAVAIDGNAEHVGKLVILPSSFMGSPRYLHEYVQDAMCFVRTFGRPDLFITFTCNKNWTEIKAELMPGQAPNDRHDIIARVFQQKVKKLMDMITKHEIFGPYRCHVYSIEWQKRGLPHIHLLLWLKEKLHSTQVDSIISAELPDPKKDPVLFKIIESNMIHGPCGSLNRESPCMSDGHCTKRYPRQLLLETQTGEDGYPLYRRRKPEDGGFTCTKIVGRNEVVLDNSWVVPYCPLLSRIFDGHINVEYCNSVKSIKYICKYIHKGSDQAVVALEDAAGEGPANQQRNEHDEISKYQTGRYVSSNEAVWRLLNFPVHDRYPSVHHLSVHLEDGQRVVFHPQNVRQTIQEPQHTTLTAFFQLCIRDDFAKTIFYVEVPRYFTWLTGNKTWKKRVRGGVVEGNDDVRSSPALGRVYTVHPNSGEIFYLRLLLHTIKGPTSFQALRTLADGTVCATYREACQRRGLLEGDAHWDNSLREASLVHLAPAIRSLFAVILTQCAPSHPTQLWFSHRDAMTEDVLNEARRELKDMTVQFTDAMYNEALLRIEDKVLSMNGNTRTLRDIDGRFPEVNRGASSIANRDMFRETNYNTALLKSQVAASRLTDDQKVAFKRIDQVLKSGTGGIIFLDAPGGTGKTYLINMLLAHVRSQKQIAIAVASSGIAATLLSGGRTAHSTFKLAVKNVYSSDKQSVCNISKNSGLAEVLKQCKLIVWDECTMSHKQHVETVDRTLRDFRDNNSVMGGTLLLLSGDFRQTLPVVPRGTPADEIKASLKKSYLWGHVRTLSLTTNMRVHLQGDTSAGVFAQRLLQIGEKQHPVDPVTGHVSIPIELGKVVTSLDQLMLSVYPNLGKNFQDLNWLCERAILAPKNDVVNIINTHVLTQLPGREKTYRSVDTTLDPDQAVQYPVEFLNTLNPSGLQPHCLTLKEGCPIILIRNLDAPKLCNGTRLCIKRLSQSLIEATVMTGCGKGETVFIPRIPIINEEMVEFKRLQFPVKPSFAMTINKSQGQSLKVAGIHLETPCFSHGQLYVACSRVGAAKNLFLLAPGAKTMNIVYPEALRK